MVAFSQTDLLNELANVFKVGLSTVREGGTLNTADEYRQLLELGAVTFLLNNDAIFYVAQLSVNCLYSQLNQEVALVEDILVGLDELGQVGRPVTDTTSLSNAKTAMLSLDAASSVSGRPEAATFNNQMNNFIKALRPNVVSSSLGILVHTKEAANLYIKSDLATLKSLHAILIQNLMNLRDLLDNYISLNLPAKASSTTMSGVQGNLNSMIASVNSLNLSANVASSGAMLLKALASQVAIAVVAGFTDPREAKYRSPVNPIPSTMTQLGRATGIGTPASIETSSGPWPFPFSGPLKLKFDKGGEHTVELDLYSGSFLNGRSSETFDIEAANQNLYVVVDPLVYQGVVSVAPTTSSVTIPAIPLGFKHLGSIIIFSGGLTYPNPGLVLPDDTYPRVITELPLKATISDASYDSAAKIVTTALSTPFSSGHVGGYLRNGIGVRLEITEYLLPNAVRVSDYTGSFAITNPTYLHAIVPADTDVTIAFTPALTGSSLSALASIGPTIKMAQLPVDVDTSVVEVCSAVTGEGGVDADNPYSALNRSVVAQPSYSDATKVSLGSRSRQSPVLQIASSYLAPSAGSVGLPTTMGNPAYATLGYNLGERLNPQFDSGLYLSPEELASAINAEIESVGSATVQNAEITRGSLVISPEYDTVVDLDGRDFNALGVQVGDLLEILTGGSAGLYPIDTVTGDILTVLRASPFSIGESGIPYRIQRNNVLISSVTLGQGSLIQVTAAPSSLGLSTGITHGASNGFEALDKNGLPFAFTDVAEGDLLRLMSGSTVYKVASVETDHLILKDSIPSTTKDMGFEILSSASLAYTAIHDRLLTYTLSNMLLKLHKFDIDLSALDNAIAQAITPNMGVAASSNQAKRIAADLLSILTAAPRRASEYTTKVPTAPDNLEVILTSYSVSSVPALNHYLDALTERKYNRAVDLLINADIKGFFGTDEKTGSYAGAILTASQAVLGDLPNTPTLQAQVEKARDTAVSVKITTDPDKDFSDTAGVRQIGA